MYLYERYNDLKEGFTQYQDLNMNNISISTMNLCYLAVAFLLNLLVVIYCVYDAVVHDLYVYSTNEMVNLCVKVIKVFMAIILTPLYILMFIITPYQKMFSTI